MLSYLRCDRTVTEYLLPGGDAPVLTFLEGLASDQGRSHRTPQSSSKNGATRCASRPSKSLGQSLLRAPRADVGRLDLLHVPARPRPCSCSTAWSRNAETYPAARWRDCAGRCARWRAHEQSDQWIDEELARDKALARQVEMASGPPSAWSRTCWRCANEGILSAMLARRVGVSQPVVARIAGRTSAEPGASGRCSAIASARNGEVYIRIRRMRGQARNGGNGAGARRTLPA